MRRSNSKSRMKKAMLAMMMCSSLVVSAPTQMLSVHATEGIGTTMNSGTAMNGGTEAMNVDPNGVLGKNSDVGIDVTKSITGKAGKKVKISFKVKSTDVERIKLKSVYPVIDSEFPFETSGDAYKVVSSGNDAEKQKSMDLQYSMTARSDLETGYHSVKFIAEYSVLNSDETESSYYVIKTINIYFSGKTSNNSSSGKDKDSNNGDSTTNNNSTNNYNYYSSSDDDDDDYYDDDDDDNNRTSSGGNSSNSSADASAPKLLVTGYQTKPEKIMAGEKFELTVHIKNTAKSTAVCNGKFLIGNEAGTFLPTSGSNAVFIEKIEAGKTGDLKIEMKTSPDLAQKNYSLIIKGDFDDGKGNSYTSNDSLSVPVYQQVKLGIADIQMSPESIGVGMEGSLMFTINNQGNANVSNVTVAVDDKAVSSEGCYVGNIAGSASAYATLNVTGQADNQETGKIKIVINYEDTDGNAGKLEQEVDCIVGEGIDSDMEFYDDEEFDDEDEDGLPFWVYIIAGVAALLIIIIIVIVLVKKKKKKEAALFDDDDDDYGEDDIEDENF